MAKPMESESAVHLEEVVLAQAFEFEALLNVLERRGRIINRNEVLEEIKRLRASTAAAKGPREGSS